MVKLALLRSMNCFHIAGDYLLLLLLCTTVLVSSNPVKVEDTAAVYLPISQGHSSSRKDINNVMNNNEKNTSNLSTKPIIIGVLTQVLRDYKRFTQDRHLHLASSYVKWIESAGAQVMPILLNQDDLYYEQIFNLTNGLLLPGGDNLLDPNKNTPMMVAAKKLYKLAVESNDRGEYYPIWGTCLGFELLSVLTSNRNVLVDCSANDLALPMTINPDERGKMFAKKTNSEHGIINMKNLDYSKAVLEALENKNLTYNYHHKCLTYQSLIEANLEGFYRPLAYSKDKKGLEFITIMEAVRYPFYGVQFHPEKPAFEFIIKKSQKNIPHSDDAIAVSRYFADFFIHEANQNRKHKIMYKQMDIELEEDSSDQIASLLIYSHNPMYTGLKRDMYEQRYLFPFVNTNSTSSEEFMDYKPGNDEEPPEDVVQNKQQQVALKSTFF